MLKLLSRPWPWYVAGPLIGLMVPVLLLADNRLFGVSSNLRTICAMTLPSRTATAPDYLHYDWRNVGGWNLAFALGVLIGGVVAATVLHANAPVGIASSTHDLLTTLGVRDFSGIAPSELFSWSALATVRGFVVTVVGGFLIGFGSSYAGGCTSGHAITGLADFQLPSLLAVIGFFGGGLIASWWMLPWLLALPA